MAGKGVEERDVLVTRVRRLPDVAPDLDVLEEATGLDFCRVVLDLARPKWWPLAGVALADRVVGLLDLAEERIEPFWESMGRAPERQVTTVAKKLMRFAIPDRRVDPVPGGGAIDEVERAAPAGPCLERRDMDLCRKAGQIAACVAKAGSLRLRVVRSVRPRRPWRVLDPRDRLTTRVWRRIAAVGVTTLACERDSFEGSAGRSALLGRRRSSPRPAADDRLPSQAPLPTGALA
jgi:hypothetical protein